MKRAHFLPPIVALILGTLWLGSEQHLITNLENETQLLREHIAAARHSDTPAEDPSLISSKHGRPKNSNPHAIDWKKLIQSMANDGRLSETETINLYQKFWAMSSAELMSAHEEIAALELSEEERGMLRDILIVVLAQKEPHLALECAGDKINAAPDHIRYALAAALQRWSQKDLPAATAWLDQQIATGKLDSKSLDGKIQSRLWFESALVSSLLATDPAAAEQRMMTLPENQRGAFFGRESLIQTVSGKEKDFADLARKYVSADQMGAACSSVTQTLIRKGGYEEVELFLNQIEANPIERRAIAAEAVKSKMMELTQTTQQVTHEDIGKMRAWVAQHSPDAVDTITGEALVDFGGRKSPFADRVKLIEQFHAETGSDKLLIGFLSGQEVSQNRDAALALAAKISDEAQRAKIIKNLTR